MSVLDVRRLGRTNYADCLELQRELAAKRADGEIGDVLILTEHDPVVTVGRGAKAAELGELSVPIVEIERGGEATYHGPGQLVAYPILALDGDRRDLHRYMRDLEEVVIGVLGEFGLEGERREGMTGVWVAGGKICSIGVAVRRWISFHGLAVNLHTDLAAFQTFRPCGLDPGVMTRLADHVDLPPTNLLGEVLLVKHFTRVFDKELPEPPPSEGPLGFGGGGHDGSGFRPLPVL